MGLSFLQKFFRKKQFLSSNLTKKDLPEQVFFGGMDYLMFAWVLTVMAVVGMTVVSLEITMVPSRMPDRMAL